MGRKRWNYLLTTLPSCVVLACSKRWNDVTIIVPFLFFGVVLVASCGKEQATNTTQIEPYLIQVQFQIGFDDDSAIVMFNEQIVASVDSITTNPVIVLAASRSFMMVPGSYVLSVLIPSDNVRTDTTFVHVEKELWVGVNYDRRQQAIQYSFQYSPFFYR